MQAPAMDYTQESTLWLDQSPVAAHLNRLMLLNASADEMRWYRNKFWKVENLVFSPGLAAQLSEKAEPFVFYDLWRRGEPDVNPDFDLVLTNHGASVVEDLNLITSLGSWLLKPGAKLVLRCQNKDFYYRQLALMDREVFPWPHHFPGGSSWRKQEIEAAFKKAAFEKTSFQAITDPLFHNPESAKWQWVKGFGCACRLPGQEDEKLNAFIQEFVAEAVFSGVKPEQQAEEANRAAALPPGGGSFGMESHAQESPEPTHGSSPIFSNQSPEELLERTQKFLEDGKVDEAWDMIVHLKTIIPQSAQLFNLQGVHAFYMRDFLKAWDLFLTAINHDAQLRDAYVNLMVCGKQLGRPDQARVIIKKASDLLPGILEEADNA